MQDFIFQYCYAHGLTSGLELQSAKYFADQLQRQVAARPDGGAGGRDLLAAVRHTTELLWSSNLRFEGMGDHARESCSLLNAAIREDLDELASPTASLTRGINALCLQGREDAALPFFADGEVYRGTGFDDTHRAFFEVDRVPGFLATSFSEAKAREFLHRAQVVGQQASCALGCVGPPRGPARFDQALQARELRRAFSGRRGRGESECLFTAYSIFTVRRVTWGGGLLRSIWIRLSQACHIGASDLGRARSARRSAARATLNCTRRTSGWNLDARRDCSRRDCSRSLSEAEAHKLLRCMLTAQEQYHARYPDATDWSDWGERLAAVGISLDGGGGGGGATAEVDLSTLPEEPTFA